MRVDPAECLVFEDAPSGVEVGLPKQHAQWVCHPNWAAADPYQRWHGIKTHVHMYPEYNFCSLLQAATAAGMRVVVVPSLAKSEYPQPDPAAVSGALPLLSCQAGIPP